MLSQPRLRSERLRVRQIPGQTTYPSAIGVMGTSIDVLHLVLKSIISTEPWQRDPNVVPLPWREPIYNDTMRRATTDGFANGCLSLKLGIYSSNGVVNPHPPIARGLKLVVDALKNAGHKVNKQWCRYLST